MQKICPQHQGLFETQHLDQVYCSRLCKDRARRLRQGAKPLARRSWKVGLRFNRLVLAGYKPQGNRQVWLCDCDCGTKGFEARADKLRDGRQQSCGCLHREYNQRLLDQRLKQKEEQDAARLAESSGNGALWTERRRNEAFKWAELKHKSLVRYLSAIGTPLTDPLWKLSYYSEFIKDGCTYCRGPLATKGASLGEINPMLSFDSSNVVPECQFCESRNLWSDTLTFEERSLLGQTIELIRLKRARRGFPLFVSKNDLL